MSTSSRPSNHFGLVVLMSLALLLVFAPMRSARALATRPVAGAAAPIGGPAVSMVLQEVAVGSVVSLRISGFAAKVLTVQVCGNEGRRGSVDCNVGGATTIDVPPDRSVFLAPLTMTRPPVPCPCLVQVSSERFDEVAISPFTLLGHPIAAVKETDKSSAPLQISVVAEPARDGWMSSLRSSLAGATDYDVTVVVKNASTSAVPDASLGVTVGRNSEDQIQEVIFPALGNLAPQETWRQTVQVRLPSPVYGTYVWHATTTTFGLSTTSTTSTRHQPMLLAVLAVVFGLVVLTLIARLTLRTLRRVARSRRLGAANPLGIAP